MTTIKKQLEAIRPNLEAVINGDLKRFKCELVTPDMVETALAPLGFERGDLETNGWDYDWWLPFTKDGKSFTAMGSGYYGTFEFAPTED